MFRSSWVLIVLVAGAAGLSLFGCGGKQTPAKNGVKRVDPADFSQRNIIVIVIDTLRADHLSCYGYSRETAPFLCGLAERSVFFERAISASTYTAPATASIFVGSYPSRHGVITGFVDHGQMVKRNPTMTLNRIPEFRTTMAEFLHDQGYTTVAVADNLNICHEMGFDQGFDSFASFRYEGADRVNRQVLQWREKLESAEKFFLYLHYMDPHKPYNSRSDWPDPAVTDAGKLVDAYDSEIRYVDRHLSNLFNRFGWLKDSIVIVLSDHGEEFGEHGGEGHGRTLYREVVHVPFFIAYPDLVEQIRVEKTVSTVSVLPTLSGLLGAQQLEEWESPSLAEVVTGGRVNEQPVFSELLRHPKDRRARVRSVVDGEDHLVLTKTRRSLREKPGLFDLAADPEERINLVAGRPARAEELRKTLALFSQRPVVGPHESIELELDAEAREQLHRLGYVD